MGNCIDTPNTSSIGGKSMDVTVTESQKRLIVGLVAAFISIMIFTMFLRPKGDDIAEAEMQWQAAKETADAYRAIVEDTTLTATYQSLKEETRKTFEENYRSFKANEKIEEILLAYNIPLKSLNIGEYNLITPDVYEKKVAQPKNQEDYDAMIGMINSPYMGLFFKSDIIFSVDADLNEQLKIIDSINNIPPEGPGGAQASRYCMELKSVSLNVNKEGTVTYEASFYGMEPPSILEME